MLKFGIMAAALSLALSVPSYAQDKMTCDEATLTKMKVDIDAMTDKEKQAMSMKSHEKAMAAMTAKNMDECMKAMEESNQQMGRGGDTSKSGTDAAKTTN